MKHPLSTNFSHQLKINTVSDLDIRRHIMPSSSSQQTSRQASTSGNHLTVQCVAIYLTTSFDTVSHEILIYNIAGSSLQPAITRWLSCYLRGRQAATSFRGIKSIVRTGIPQGSKLSPSLFNYYIAVMPRPTSPVKRVCYADAITVRASGPKIPQLESMINSYLRDVGRHLPEGKLAFDLCAEVNSHTLHPGNTPVPYASIYYS